jgi:rhodanese-related sulfurtransferase
VSGSAIIYALIFIGFIWVAYTRFRPTKGLRTLQDADFRSEMNQRSTSLLIDVREPSEYKSGYIPGAKNIPLSQLNRRLAEIPKDSNLLLYCRSGMRSQNASRVLLKNGYTQVAHLQGGIGAWNGKLSK